MQLRLDSLEPHLAKGLAGLYVVYGDEHLLAQEACDRIRATARANGFTDRTVFTVERGFDWSSLLGASQSMSLFGDRQLVELRIPTGKPGKEGADALKTLAAAVNPDVLTLVTLPRLDAATQKSAWFVLHRLRYAARTQSFNAPLEGDTSAAATETGTRTSARRGRARAARRSSWALLSAAET